MIVVSHQQLSPGRRGTEARLQLSPGRRGIEIEDPELDAALSEHRQLLPKELRTKLVSDAVLAERQVFFK